MGVMKTAAVRGIIPSRYKLDELRSNLLRLISETCLVLEERYEKDGLAIVSEIFQRLGEQDAIIMKDKLGLGETLQDSVDAWKVIGHIMGSKMEINYDNQNRAVADHSLCPQYELFKKIGKLHYCEFACLPYVAAVAENLVPGVKMEVVRAADNNSACTKALVHTTE